MIKELIPNVSAITFSVMTSAGVPWRGLSRASGYDGDESKLRSAVSGSTPGGTYCVHAQCSHRFSTPGRTVQQAGVR